MQFDEHFQNNFNNIENYDTCFYCETTAENCLGKCEECKHLFCNGLSEENSYSHLIYHLKKSGHRNISLFPHNRILKCNECESSNTFDLFVENNIFYCSHHKTNESIKLLLENYRIINQILPVSTLDADKERLRNCSFQQMKFRENLISEIEEDKNLNKIKEKYFNVDDYFNIDRPLIKAELKICKILFETRKEIEIYLRHDNINIHRVCFRIPRSYSGISFILGKFLTFTSTYDQTFVFSGVINYIDKQTRNIFIYPIEKNVNSISQGEYKIKEQFSDVSFLRMLDGLDYFRDYTDSISFNLNNAILGIDNIKRFNIGNRRIKSIQGYGSLNYKQRVALDKVFQNSLNMIQGPPGTGKTFLASFIIYNIFINKPYEKILVSAPSNDACDNITKSLLEINNNLTNQKMKILRIVAKGREYVNYSYIIQNISLHSIIDRNNYNNQQNFIEANIREIDKYNIIITTCSTSMDDRLKTFKFPYVIIDEATQSTEIESLLPIIHGANHITLIGDQNQLRPVTFHPKSSFLGMDISLFERMIKIHPQNLIQLTEQYRMHPKIIEYSSRKFYNNTLINSYQVRNNGRVNINFNQNFRWFNNDIPIMFIHIEERENLSSSGCSWENEKEANLVCQIVRKIINCGINPNDIGIITPYLAQRELIENKLFNYNINNILISSVDSFQGQEKDFMIVSTVRSNLSDRIGFVEDPRRLNVTLTRAKYGLIFIGNAKCLSNSKDHNGGFTIWRNLIKYYQDIKVLCCYNNDNFSSIDNIVQDDFNWNYIPEFDWDNNQFYDNHYQYRGNYRNNFRYRGNNNYYYRRNGYMSGRRYY